MRDAKIYQKLRLERINKRYEGKRAKKRLEKEAAAPAK